MDWLDLADQGTLKGLLQHHSSNVSEECGKGNAKENSEKSLPTSPQIEVFTEEGQIQVFGQRRGE